MNAAYQQLDAVRRRPMAPVIGRLFVSRTKVLTVTEQIPAPALDLCTDSFIQGQPPTLTDQEPAKMKTVIERLTYLEKLAMLTLQYLELSLPLPAALRAAEADL
jgi:hypothetical protein